MALGVEGQVCAQVCTYQPMKTSREWCTVEQVASGFRSATASNGWICACQRMAGAELQDLLAVHMSLGPSAPEKDY